MMDKLCRVCLATEKSTKFQQIFNDEAGTSEIAADLYFLCDIIVVDLNQQQSLICSQCLECLRESVKFKKIAKVADDYFRKQSKDEEIKLWKRKMKMEGEINPSEVLKQEIEHFTIEDVSDDDFVPNDFGDFFNSAGHRKKKPRKKPKLSKCHCGVVLSCERRLKEHILTRHQEIRLEDYVPCHICGKKFKVKSYVERHIKMKHTNPECGPLKKVPCSVCGKLLAKGALKAHEGRHYREQGGKSVAKFTCDLCGHSTTEKSYILQHIERIHLKLKKFKCKFCSAAFIHGSLLDYHTRKHLNLRTYACRFCNKSFTRKYCCKIHERIHTDERPYSCRFCDRTFIHHSDHRRHELRHTGGIHKKEFDAKLMKGSIQPKYDIT